LCIYARRYTLKPPRGKHASTCIFWQGTPLEKIIEENAIKKVESAMAPGQAKQETSEKETVQASGRRQVSQQDH
jgi:hypothetical protein